MATSSPARQLVALDAAPRYRTCYISAPEGIDLRPIKSALQSRSITPLVLSELPPTWAPLSEQAGNVIDRADLVIAVLESNKATGNVYFEIGYAYAAGKRIGIVASPDLVLPSIAAGLPYVRSDPGNERIINFFLDHLASAPPLKRHINPPIIDVTHPIGDVADDLLRELASLGEGVTEAAVISLMRKALAASGVLVVVEPEGSDGRSIIDLAVWSDDLVTLGGNPLLIEIKRDLRRSASADQVAKQILEYMRESDSRLSMVLYALGPSTRELDTESLPSVLFVRVSDLLGSMRTAGFGPVVREIRNRVAHGPNPSWRPYPRSGPARSSD